MSGAYRERLDQRLRSPAAVFHKFRTAANKDSILHVFVEGYDDCAFYGKLIESLRIAPPEGWSEYVCFGKKNMDRILQLFYSSSFTSAKVIFIRDSDFDKFLGLAPTGSHVFLTCGYSVENYACAPEIISKFMRMSWGLDSTEVDISFAVSQHEEILKRLFSALIPFFGAAIFAIRAGRQLDLSKLDVSELYRAIKAHGNAPIPADQIANCGLLDADFNNESQELGERFAEQDVFLWLRGKYIMECSAIFLQGQLEYFRDLYKNEAISRFNRRASTDFSSSALLERLSAYLDPPLPLVTALQAAAA